MRTYPDTRTRLLRARERGIRHAAAEVPTGHNGNPFSRYGSGSPLAFAWDMGYWLSITDGDVPAFHPGAFDPINLSSEFNIFLELFTNEELPDSWPRAQAVAA